MSQAYDQLKKTLETITFNVPRIPVVLNVDALPEADPSKIKERLLDQLVKPVLWEKSIVYALKVRSPPLSLSPIDWLTFCLLA